MTSLAFGKKFIAPIFYGVLYRIKPGTATVICAVAKRREGRVMMSIGG
jgi:hypothetical protein